MYAAVVKTLGQPPQYEKFSDPVPDSGEVLIKMLAAGLHPLVKAKASGQHYSSTGKLPLVPGVDGIGELDGKLVYCLGSREGWGTMAERTVAQPKNCILLPSGIDLVQAAAICNPGMSAWLSLNFRAKLKKGESVLILGATGVAGHLAIQVARYLGASRIIGVGRNVEALKASGVDSIVPLDGSEEEIIKAFEKEIGSGIDVIVDYLWGRPTELLLNVLGKSYHAEATKSTRLVEVGDSAGKSITLAGSLLRSVDLILLGSGFGSVSFDQILKGIGEVLKIAAEGHLKVDAEPVSLSKVNEVWNNSEKGKRIVFTINR